MRFRPGLIRERLFAQIRQPAMHFQIDPLKIVELPSQPENLLCQWCANFEGLRVRLFIELSQIGRTHALLVQLNFDELGETGFKNLAVGNRGVAWRGPRPGHGYFRRVGGGPRPSDQRHERSEAETRTAERIEMGRRAHS